MKTFLPAVLFALILPAQARAAAECSSFAGGYAGVNAGIAQHESTWVDRDAWIDNFGNDWALGSVETKRQGVAAGLQGGYNWQRRCSLLGVEADLDWATVNGAKKYQPATGGTELELIDSIKWFSTLRARAGVVVDDILLFVTGGLAGAHFGHEWTVRDPAAAVGVENFKASTAPRWGPVTGAGVELSLSERWSLKSEALYARFPNQASEFNSTAGNQLVHFDSIDSLFVARVGVNYRFGK